MLHGNEHKKPIACLSCCVNTSSVTLAGDQHCGVQKWPFPGSVQLAHWPHIWLLAHVGTSAGLHATDSAHHTCSIGLHCADLAIPVQWATWHLRCKYWHFHSHNLSCSALSSFLFLFYCFCISFCLLPSSQLCLPIFFICHPYAWTNSIILA
jgi:hypothetical protein